MSIHHSRKIHAQFIAVSFLCVPWKLLASLDGSDLKKKGGGGEYMEQVKNPFGKKNTQTTV